MPLTSEQFQAWLQDPQAVKCTLVEVGAFNGVQDTTVYLSTKNYNTKSNEVPASTHYLPVLSTGVEFTENLSLDGSATLSYGDIAIENPNGEFDHWADWVWGGQPVNIFIGDVRAPRADFTLIFSGIINDVAFRDRNTVNLVLRDILQRLNTSVTETLLGPYGTKTTANQNKEQIRPLVFGEVHNITPLLIDDVELEYMVHNGPIERLIEVRDNGIPVEVIPNLAQGTFKLLYPAAGTITCSVQGDKFYVDNTGVTFQGYRNTVGKLIQRIITGFGKPGDAILASEMDLPAFEAFDAEHQQPVGIYIAGKENVIDICQQLASSVGAQLASDRVGKLRMVKLDIPVMSAVEINDNDIINNTLQISEKIPVVGSVKLNYCRNWTPQTGLLTNIPEEHKTLYNQEYLVKFAQDTQVLSRYKLSAEVTPKDTLILTNALLQVDQEAQRLLDIFKTPRFVITLETTSKFLNLKLGDMVVLKHARYGLSAGKPAQVISVSINWDTGTSRLGVLV
jgi:hypothetical protein